MALRYDWPLRAAMRAPARLRPEARGAAGCWRLSLASAEKKSQGAKVGPRGTLELLRRDSQGYQSQLPKKWKNPFFGKIHFILVFYQIFWVRFHLFSRVPIWSPFYFGSESICFLGSPFGDHEVLRTEAIDCDSTEPFEFVPSTGGGPSAGFLQSTEGPKGWIFAIC